MATGQQAGVVLIVHGGRSRGTQPTTAFQLAVLRMVPLARAVRAALRGSGAQVRRPRLAVRGWNGAQASPVADLTRLLEEASGAGEQAPVVLIGHSMGARAALRVAGHPRVSAVACLAPWLPAGEPVGQLAGRPVLLVHGTADTVTDPADTWAYAERARAVTTVATIEIRGGGHAMLFRGPLWHGLAAAFARAALGLPAGPAEPAGASRPAGAAAAIAAATSSCRRIVL